MANLYQINEQILGCVDMETGEIVDMDKLQELQLEFDQKVEGIGCWIKNLLSEAKALDEEKKNLAARQKACENKAESLKEYLQTVLGGQKFKTPKVSISYRKSEQVQVDDINLLGSDYLKFEPKADKTKIKQDIKDGIPVAGCQLIEKQNIQIK